MHIPPVKDESLQPQYTFNREQGEAIIQGLQLGNRLAYDADAKKFVVLHEGSSKEKHIQDLDTLSYKVNEFIKLL